jgi:hypothetical protein
MSDADKELREYWRNIANAWQQLADALPTMNEEQRETAKRYMKEIAEELPSKLRAFL